MILGRLSRWWVGFSDREKGKEDCERVRFKKRMLLAIRKDTWAWR